MSRIIERALSIINDNLKDQTSSFADPVSIKPMARGGRLLEDDYPTHYLPHVGRQVMADGGDADPVSNALTAAQSIPETPMPSLRPTPPAPKAPSAEGRVMPPSPIPQAKGVSYRTADDVALPIIEQNKESGLQFPKEESFARLHKKLRREDKAASGKETAGDPLNDRMTIKAPKDSGLPDFVTGKINYGDWIKRHENILGDEEIHHAADWYNRIYDEFKQYYPDEAEAKKNMRAWLVAQQNVSPAGAMQNVLLQKEQMKRGVPKELWRAGGMPNPTEAARDVLQSQPISGGVGQKIADFVDAAEGKSVRSWMANHPDGGEPFVVDIHTARDTGMVDQELLNHLDRLGYNKKDLAKAQIDLTGTPTEAAYENRAAWGRGLTDHLNEIGWKGRNDWTPAEIQAVGWMGMTKLTRNAEEDVQSGLAKNLRRISYEAEPAEGSPWHGKYNDRLNALSPDDKSEITSKLIDSALRHASDVSGIDVHSLVGGIGKKDVAQTLATQGGADIAANALGYLLNQGEVWHNRVKPMTSSPKGYAIDFIQPSGKDLADNEKVKDLWNKITEADDSDLFQGFHPIKLPSGEVGIRALIDKGGAKTREKIENALAENSPIQKAIADFGLDIDMLGHEAEISKARNNWTENKNGEGYMERLVELIGADRAASLDSVRQKLEGELDAHLQEVGQRQAEPPKGSRKKVAKAFGGDVESDIQLSPDVKSIDEMPDQAFTSENTSRNQIPALFNSPAFERKRGSRNLDYGGGAFDKGSEYLAQEHGVDSQVYDPFNREKEHNDFVLTGFKKEPADTATVANVLNVIAEPEARLHVIKQVHNHIKPDGKAYFTVYEGDGKEKGSGNSRMTRDGWQEYRPTHSYVEEIKQVFPDVRLSGKTIVASKKAAKAYGGALIPGPKLTEENADDFARRLIAWTFATAPLFHKASGGSVIDDPLDVISKLRR
jgi:hypothetical protein